MGEELRELRDEIAGLDRALLELLERRFRLAAEVGRIKAERGQAVTVREVEQRVLQRAREYAEACGVSDEVMDAIFQAIIRGSVERQHRVGVGLRAQGGAHLLVLGGAGAMGGWLRHFLAGIGHRVDALDTAWAGLPPAEGRFAELGEIADLDAYDGIIVSVPLDVTGEVLSRLAERTPSVPVVEIASIKEHLRAPLAALRDAGAPALSLHPMFGPGKSPYEPLTVVHAVIEDEDAERDRVLAMLHHPYLELVSIPFDRHDRLMGWLLGLAHLSGILFGAALTRCGLDAGELARVASTTFARQAATARSVLEEDPDLYFAIQRLNPHRGQVYSALTAALGELTGAVERNDRDAFTEAMAHAAGFLPGQP